MARAHGLPQGGFGFLGCCAGSVLASPREHDQAPWRPPRLPKTCSGSHVARDPLSGFPSLDLASAIVNTLRGRKKFPWDPLHLGMASGSNAQWLTLCTTREAISDSPHESQSSPHDQRDPFPHEKGQTGRRSAGLNRWPLQPTRLWACSCRVMLLSHRLLSSIRSTLAQPQPCPLGRSLLASYQMLGAEQRLQT